MTDMDTDHMPEIRKIHVGLEILTELAYRGGNTLLEKYDETHLHALESKLLFSSLTEEGSCVMNV